MNIRKYIPGTFENISDQKSRILSSYHCKKRATGVYVSMTTYSPRLAVFEFAILSVLRGTLLPEKILIYVPKGFTQSVLENRDSFLKDHLSNGLINIIEMDIDMKCHSKYFYSFQEFGATNDIVLCDDDVVYYKDWLKDLVTQAKKYPEFQVFAFKAVDVHCSSDRILPYDNWTHCNSRHQGKDKQLYAEGVGGVYYRKNSFKHKTFDADTFLNLSENADDVWLWFWTHYNELRVKYVKTSFNRKLQYIIPNSQGNALWVENTINRRNDIYVKNCHRYFRDELGFDIVEKINASNI